MAYIIETPNPFEPLTSIRKHQHPGGISIWQWLRETYPGFTEFPQPTICLVNGQPLLRKDWDRIIGPDDVVNFVTLPAGGVAAIVAIVVAALAVGAAIAFALTLPDVSTDTPTSDPVYSLRGRGNQARLGEPIEIPYGRNRIYPSYAARPFVRYKDNDQYLHALFCIGVGEYQVHEVRIGDSNITDYPEVEYEIIPPGGQTTLFRTNIHVVSNVGGLKVPAPNEPEYVGEGWVGPFAVCPPDEIVDLIEVDIVFPKGLGRVNKKGNLEQRSVSLQIQLQEIDSLGGPVGPWINYNVTFTRGTTTVLRQTLSYPVTPRRFQIRMRRTNNYDAHFRTMNDVVWDGLRSFMVGSEPNYGNVTLLAVKAKATANLNDRSQNAFNVICTRKLRMRNPDGTWTDPQPTRSIIWAFVDVFKSTYGGRIQDDRFFDWDSLYELEDLYQYRGEHFDWVFRDATTVWDAAVTIARAGRATPILSGSRITMRRDGPVSVPVTMFTPENIIRGTFEWNIKLWDPLEPDGVNVEYVDPSTGYLPEKVPCVLPGDLGNYLEDVRLPGVQDRQHAYREGLYLQAVRRYIRENIVFETGMEGMLPSYGDLILISHDVPRWGQSGYVVDAEDLGSGQYLLTLSEPLSWDPPGSYNILLRGKKGEVLGPYGVSPTSDPKKVTVTIGSSVDFLLTGDTEPMLFLFGPTGNETLPAKVVSIEPQGGERVRITAVPYKPVIYSFDSLVAPPLDQPSLPPQIPDAPTIPWLRLSQEENAELVMLATWGVALGARFYVMEVSRDGQTWTPIGQTISTSVRIPVASGTTWFRVAAVNNGQGPWSTSSLTVSLILGLEVTVPWETQYQISWWEVSNVDGYRVKVYDASQSSLPLIRTEDVTGTSFTYNLSKRLADGVASRWHRIEVDALVADDGTPDPVGSPRSIDVQNQAPSEPPDNIQWTRAWTTGLNILHQFTWDLPSHPDLYKVKIWLTEEQGFDPETTPPILELTGTAPGVGVPTSASLLMLTDSTGEVLPDQYAMIGVFDPWGDEIGDNVSVEINVSPPWILAGGVWDNTGRWRDSDNWKDS